MDTTAAYRMMLELLEAYNDFNALEAWASEYGHTLRGKRYHDQWQGACEAAARRAKQFWTPRGRRKPEGLREE